MSASGRVKVCALFSLLFTPTLLFWSQLFDSGSAELRFCLPDYGPQRMKDDDCPGGFFFEESVTPLCKYYAKTGDHTGKVLYGPADVCSEDSDRIIEDEGDDMSDIGRLTYFLWEDFDTTNDSQKGTFKPTNICEEECLSEWEDPHSVVEDEGPILDDFDRASLPDEQLKSLKKFNKEMLMRLLMDDDDEEDMLIQTSNTAIMPQVPIVNSSGSSSTDGVQLPARSRSFRKSKGLVFKPGYSYLNRAIHDLSLLNVVKILAKSMKIMVGACSPFVTEDFMEQVLKGMIYISRKVEHSFMDASPDLYTKMSMMLDHCGLKRHQEFVLNGSRCEELSSVDGVYFIKSDEYWPHRLHGWSFRWGRWHPLLDAAWSVIDFIHSFCFESFMQDMMMLHIYEMSLEGLFSEKIQLLWRLAPGVNNDNFWNNLLQTFDLNTTMRNMDACQEGARRATPYQKSLPRPFLTLTEIMRPPSPPQTQAQRRKGWNKTIAQYWERYDKLGGFPKMSSDYGKCLTEVQLEVEQEMIDSLKPICF